MALEWLRTFQHAKKKEPGYAEKTLAAYALGMRARGAIVGVVIEPGANCCQAVRELKTGTMDPSEAPHLPLPACSLGTRCECVYRPVMAFQKTNG
jgi:hypothetical protein